MTEESRSAHTLADALLRMRIEIRKLALSERGTVRDYRWHEIYDLMRQYEDAQVRAMYNHGGRERVDRNRRRKKKQREVPVDKRRSHNGNG